MFGIAFAGAREAGRRTGGGEREVQKDGTDLVADVPAGDIQALHSSVSASDFRPLSRRPKDFSSPKIRYSKFDY
jgi:hypothetical protein